MLCKKFQLEILNKVIQESDWKNPVEIDRSDPDREQNLQHLYQNDCFVCFFAEGNPRQIIGIAGLSKKGYLLHMELTNEAEKEAENEQEKRELIELMRRQTKAIEGANTRSTMRVFVGRR